MTVGASRASAKPWDRGALAAQQAQDHETPGGEAADRSGELSVPLSRLIQTGDGKPLDRSARATMETALGEDLSDVRLHTDQRSASAARRLDAVAFTSGQDVFFGAGRPGLKTPSGRRLLAHELTHTIQARAGGSAVHRQHDGSGKVSNPHDAAERQADEVADIVVGGGRVSGLAASRVQHAPLQRQPETTDESAGTASDDSPLAQVRAAMSERQEIAGVGNFPKAFGVLNGLDMARLLLTMDALFATHELDILMGNIGSAAGYDIPRLRAAAAAVNEAHTGTSPVAGTADYQALSGPQQADVTNFVRMVSLRSETEALTHAAGYQPAGADRVGVLQQLGVLSRAVTSASAVAARLGIEDVVGFLPVIIDRRLSRLRASGNPDEVRQWAGQVAAQLDIVNRAVAGMTHALDLMNAASAAAGPGGVPDYVRVPLIRMAQLYADAVRGSDLVDVGYDRLGRADQRAKTLQLDILEMTAADARQMLAEAARLSPDVGTGVQDAESNFSAEVSQARALVDVDPGKYAESLRQLQEKISTLHQRAKVILTRSQFDATLNAINDLSLKASDSHPEDSKALWQLIRRLSPYHGHWLALEDAYRRGDQAAQKAGWDTVRGDADNLHALLTEIDATMKSVARTLQLDEMAVTIVVLVLVGLATGGVGDLLLGVAGGLELGGTATFLLVTGGEALFFTTATTVLLEKDPTVGKFFTDLALNLVTFSAMKGVSAIYRGVLGPAAAKSLAGTAGEALVIITASTATALSMADISKRHATGRGLTDDEAHDIVMESVIIGIASIVGGRVAHDLLPDFRNAGTRLGRQLDALNRNRARLRARAADIAVRAQLTVSPGAEPGAPGGKPVADKAGKPSPPAARLGSQADLEEIQALLDDDAAQIEQERSTLTELSAELKANPASKESAAVEAALTESEQAAARSQAAQVAAALEPIGPDEALCQQDRFDEVAEYHKKNPAQTVTEGVDPDGARTLLLTPKDPDQGRPYRITERLTPGPARFSANRLCPRSRWPLRPSRGSWPSPTCSIRTERSRTPNWRTPTSVTHKRRPARSHRRRTDPSGRAARLQGTTGRCSRPSSALISSSRAASSTSGTSRDRAPTSGSGTWPTWPRCSRSSARCWPRRASTRRRASRAGVSPSAPSMAPREWWRRSWPGPSKRTFCGTSERTPRMP